MPKTLKRHESARPGNQPLPAHGKFLPAFTLIELLVSMAILLVIVSFMARIFSESDRAWSLGSDRVLNSMGGRAALDMVSHDLEYAVAAIDRGHYKFPQVQYTFWTFPDAATNSYNVTNNEIRVISLQHDSSGEATRTAREVCYYVREMTHPTNNAQGLGRYELVRGYYGKSIVDSYQNHAYWNPQWGSKTKSGLSRPGNSQTLVENVAAFRIFVPSVGSRGKTYLTNEFYSIEAHTDTLGSIYTNRLPEFVDIYLELLNEEDARQIAKMYEVGLQAEAKELLLKSIRRHTRRVFFYNRAGYKDR